MTLDPDAQAAFTVARSSKDDPQQGDEIRQDGVVSRRVVAREEKRVGYVNGPGLGSVQWCSLLAWQLWCDGIV
jgi:hypothetical protein